VLDCLKDMGFNLLSLSNNHAWDLGEAGLRITAGEVMHRGFAHAGTGVNSTAATAPGFLDTPAGRVALIAMAAGGVAAAVIPKWCQPPGRATGCCRDARP
jgi:poly-gamma-glutamate synthesis protein (capsule biosynthesis protein)